MREIYIPKVTFGYIHRQPAGILLCCVMHTLLEEAARNGVGRVVNAKFFGVFWWVSPGDPPSPGYGATRCGFLMDFATVWRPPGWDEEFKIHDADFRVKCSGGGIGGSLPSSLKLRRDKAGRETRCPWSGLIRLGNFFAHSLDWALAGLSRINFREFGA